jgi:NAD(P)-dependent dehydrogenase (short-subunit alcohol dehydrogenase family)
VQEGAYVFIMGRAQSKLDEAVKQIGSSVTGVPCDVTVAADLDRLFERIKKDKGKLDIVVANAGIAKYAALGSIDEELFDSIFDTNVKGMLAEARYNRIFMGNNQHTDYVPVTFGFRW